MVFRQPLRPAGRHPGGLERGPGATRWSSSMCDLQGSRRKLIIEAMVKRWQAGADVVYARPQPPRRGETLVKKGRVRLRLQADQHAASDVAIPRNTGDFRLMSRRVVDALEGLAGKARLSARLGGLRGLPPGSHRVLKRPERHSGQGNYNRYLGLPAHRLQWLGGFQQKLLLLNATMVLGLAVAALSFAGAVFVVVTRFFMGINYRRNAVGIPTCCISWCCSWRRRPAGVGGHPLGQYIGRIYDEVKDRPRYLVDRAYNMPPLPNPADRKAH